MVAGGDRLRLQDFAESLGESWSAKNLGEKQQRLARIGNVGDFQKCVAELRIGWEALDARVEPAIDFRVRGPQLRLQVGRISCRIVDEEARIHAEKTR